MKPQSLIFLSLVFLDYGFSASVGVMEDDAALEDNGRELENVHDISHFHLPASDTAAKEERPREERVRMGVFRRLFSSFRAIDHNFNSVVK
jgi:hypothetical protein